MNDHHPADRGDHLATAAFRTPTAQALLTSTIPCRLAYTARNGSPRVVPLWFHWDGSDIVLGTFPQSPKVTALPTGAAVALTIDTQEYPYQSLQIRGSIHSTPTPGLVSEYRWAAHRYLGAAEAERFLARLGDRPMIRLAIRPHHARLMDMRTP